MDEPILQSWQSLEKLQGVQFFKLYKQPASALAIFRKRLSNLAKAFVMILLYMPRPFPAQSLDLFVKEGSVREREQALFLLQKYHIFKSVTANSTRSWILTPEFARSLRTALSGGSQGTSTSASTGSAFGKVKEDVPLDEQMDIEELDDYARERWEGILGFMVNSSEVLLPNEPRPRPPSAFVIKLLQGGGLIELSGGDASRTATVTKEGFAFVLQDINTQLWALLFLYVDSAGSLQMEPVDVLSFLFLISSLELGVAYSTDGFDEGQLTMLQHLEELGIIYWPRIQVGDDPTDARSWEPEDYFYPTRLATTLTSDSDTSSSFSFNNNNNNSINTSLSSGSASASSGHQSQGFIIIETNYRFYAYTNSPLQIALINLFVRINSRHPNLITGKLTKTSVARAIQAGITAEQIIAYLSAHAHPQMRRHAQAEHARNIARSARSTTSTSTSNNATSSTGRTGTGGGGGGGGGYDRTVLPATIVDQIHLWQLERDRMTTTPGYLLRDFANQAEYEAPCRYAEQIGVLVWKSDAKRQFFVRRIEQVRDFMASRKAAAAAAAASAAAGGGGPGPGPGPGGVSVKK